MKIRDLPTDVQAKARALAEAQKRGVSESAPSPRPHVASRQAVASRTRAAPAAPDPAAGPLVLELPMPPSLTNSRKGRSRSGFAVAREKREYWEALDERQRCRLVPAPPAAPWPRASLSSVMYLGNAMARHKWALDWLRTRGYVAEDRRDVLVWTDFPEQRVKRGQVYRLVLTLTPIPE